MNYERRQANFVQPRHQQERLFNRAARILWAATRFAIRAIRLVLRHLILEPVIRQPRQTTPLVQASRRLTLAVADGVLIVMPVLLLIGWIVQAV